MKELVIFLYQGLLGSLIIQALVIVWFLSYLLPNQKNLLLDSELPKTSVILCLRGAELLLPKCLLALLSQNYPDYDLKVVIDSQKDPAWKVVNDTIDFAGANNIEVKFLQVPRLNCSLKCSSLVQAVSDLDDSYKVVALVDADAVVHPNWLRELVTPLADPKIGATTGNHWYLPNGKNWGSVVRYLWNISAVVQMCLYRTPWGGTLAIKTQVIRDTGLLEKWGKAYDEDILIQKVLAKHGLQVKFIPKLLILNREECNLSDLKYWFERQLFSSRLYNPFWWSIVAESISSVIFPNLLLLVFLETLFSGQWQTAAITFTGYISYVVSLIIFALALEKGVKQVICRDGEVMPQLSLPIVMRMLIAIPLTQWVYGLAMISSLFVSTITWRGVTYRVQGPWNIRLVEYRPFQSLDQPNNNKIYL